MLLPDYTTFKLQRQVKDGGAAAQRGGMLGAGLLAELPLEGIHLRAPGRDVVAREGLVSEAEFLAAFPAARIGHESTQIHTDSSLIT